jgi:hypothetical protein
MTLQDIIAEAKKLSPQERQQLMRVLTDMPENDTVEDTQAYSLLDLAGLGAEIWRDVDAQAYVDALRDEWDN